MSLNMHDVTVAVPDGDATLTILDNLSLTVATGEVVAVTGASGSGKSTLLAVAGLLRRPDHGTVEITGVDATNLGRAAATKLRRAEIGLVFQTSNLFPALTALEQLELVAHVGGRLDRAARKRARALLVEVGLARQLDRRPAQLSGGERQRVGIARALMSDPSLLLADEPTAALDDRRGREVMDLLVTQAFDRGIATVIVTHNPAQLPRATRWLHLEEGRLSGAEPVLSAAFDPTA